MFRGVWKFYGNSVELSRWNLNFDFFYVVKWKTHLKLVTGQIAHNTTQLSSIWHFQALEFESSNNNYHGTTFTYIVSARERKSGEHEKEIEEMEKWIQRSKKKVQLQASHIFSLFAIWFVIYLITEQNSSQFLHSFSPPFSSLSRGMASEMSLISILYGNCHMLSSALRHRNVTYRLCDSVGLSCIVVIYIAPHHSGLDCGNVKMDEKSRKKNFPHCGRFDSMMMTIVIVFCDVVELVEAVENWNGDENLYFFKMKHREYLWDVRQTWQHVRLHFDSPSSEGKMLFRRIAVSDYF